MTSRPQVISTLPTLCRTVQRFRAAGESVALVPTMGALHEGHLALVRLARRRAKRVIVSIFVNPAQFAPSEDFASYPRTFAADIAALKAVATDIVWAPSVAQMYPKGFAVEVVPQGPAIVGLEDAFRPHFFAGVATVVAKLMLQCLPDVAVFGEKDFQQLRVVAHMARDLDIPVKIVGAPTVREPDGRAACRRAPPTPGAAAMRGQGRRRTLDRGRAGGGARGARTGRLPARLSRGARCPDAQPGRQCKRSLDPPAGGRNARDHPIDRQCCSPWLD